ncbi:MAG: hypothetical protein CMJ83_07565 [Planctomycetes bacterium]|nr:hypothetical protein [Planctomycetota bacterium]
MDLVPEKAPSSAPRVLLALGAAMAASLVVLALPVVKPLQAIGLLSAFFIPAAAWFSGNPRLFLLWGLLITAPMEFSKYFVSTPHFGGEVGIRLEASDVFLVPLIIMLLADHLRGRLPVIRVPFVGRCWIFLMLMGVGTMVFGTFKSAAGYEVVRMFKVLALFLVLVNHIARPRMLQQLVIPVIIGIALESVAGLSQYFLKANFGLGWLGEPDKEIVDSLGFQGSRIGALMIHPNVFGAYLAMCLPIPIALLFSSVSRSYKVLAIVTILLGEAALVLTLSRTGWISFGFAMLIVLVLTLLHRRMRRRHVMLHGAVIGLVVVFGLVFSTQIIARFYGSDPNALRMRFELMDIAWRMIQDKPLFGFGLNSWTWEMHDYTHTPLFKHFKGADAPPIHNIYLIFWVEQGTLGLLVWMIGNVTVIWMAIKNLAVKNDVLYAINIGCLAGFSAILLDGLADWVIRLNSIMRVYWTLAALIVAIRMLDRRGLVDEPTTAPDERGEGPGPAETWTPA